MSKLGFVYKITNLKNGKIYVGATLNINRRIGKHKHMSLSGKSNSLLHIDMRKYGFDSFRTEVIECCTEEDYLKKEIFYINSLKTYEPFGYNYRLTSGSESVQLGKTKSIQVFSISNKKISTYNSISDFSRYAECTIGAVTLAINKKRILYGKYIIKYLSDKKSFEDIIREIEIKKSNEYLHDSLVRQGRVPHNIKKVKLINKESKEELVFDSVTKAAEYLKRQSTNVSFACDKKGRVVGGHLAEYME
jgi:predicted GIY-YIG superfamily endonuclease